MSDISFSVPEGTYTNTFTTVLQMSANIKELQYSVNGAPPSMSKYIAYDRLSPPNPFIAVTEDGNGKVVYDGGFIKFNNLAGQTIVNSGLGGPYLELSGNLNSGTGNSHYYRHFSNKEVLIENGDKLVFGSWRGNANSEPSVDCEDIDGFPLRSYGYTVGNSIVDQNGRPIHAAGNTWQPANQWVYREFNLSAIAGKRLRKWYIVDEGDVVSYRLSRFREIFIIDRNGKIKAEIFSDDISNPPNTPVNIVTGSYTFFMDKHAPSVNFSPAFAYFYSAIRWISNKTKIATNNRKVLVLGDASATDPYYIKSTDDPGYITVFNNVFGSMGMPVTYKVPTDYAGGLLNPTLAELNEYACVVFMGTLLHGASPTPKITEVGADALVAYRQAGGGLFLITDHGPVISTYAQIDTVTGGFFQTINRVAKRFGAWFSGDYDRVPVNVGYIRQTYGDHPLFAPLNNSADIPAGVSESRVFVAEYPVVLPGSVTPFPIGNGVTTIHVLARRHDNSTVALSVTYVVVQFKVSIDHDGVLIDHGDEINVGIRNQIMVALKATGTLPSSFSGRIELKGTQIGTFSYTTANGLTATWSGTTGCVRAVENGDTLSVIVTTPAVMTNTATIKRSKVPNIQRVRPAEFLQYMGSVYGEKNHVNALKRAIKDINFSVPWPVLKYSQRLPETINQIVDQFNNRGVGSQVLREARVERYNSSLPYFTGDYTYWTPTNPVTGATVDMKYILVSNSYPTNATPDYTKRYYFRRFTFPVGNYRFYTMVDDSVTLEIEGVVTTADLIRRQSAAFTVTRSEETTMRLKLSNGTGPSYLAFCIINTTTGEVVMTGEPGKWRIVES